MHKLNLCVPNARNTRALGTIWLRQSIKYSINGTKACPRLNHGNDMQASRMPSHDHHTHKYDFSDGYRHLLMFSSAYSKAIKFAKISSNTFNQFNDEPTTHLF